MRYLFLRAGRDVSVYYTACLASAGWGLSQCVNELLYIDTNLIRSSSSSSSPLLYNIMLELLYSVNVVGPAENIKTTS